MSLLSRLSTLGGVDPLPTTLGLSVRPTAPRLVEPAPKQVAPGLFRRADGKLFTDFPLPKAPELQHSRVSLPQAEDGFHEAAAAAALASAVDPASAVLTALDDERARIVALLTSIRARAGETWQPGSNIVGLRPGDKLMPFEYLYLRPHLSAWNLAVSETTKPSGGLGMVWTVLRKVEINEVVPIELVQNNLVWPRDKPGMYRSVPGSQGLVYRAH